MRLGLAAAAALALASLSTEGAAPSPVVSPPSVVPESRDGLWIWTRADSLALVSAPRRVLPGVLVATLEADGPRVKLRRGLSPGVVAPGPVALVVRLDDSLRAAFRERPPRELARDLDTLLGQVLTEARGTGIVFHEIQLDYDAPVRRLAEWADVVRALGRSSLAGLRIWITSIPSHLDEPAYEALFSGVVEGHELQLFDTGLPCNARELGRLRARLASSPLPFRVGVGAFERGGRSEHACWARASESLRTLSGYAGIWVFPAGSPQALVLGGGT